MAKPEIVPAEQWQQARDDLLKAEKEATRALDALAARRRRLPMVKFGSEYVFDTPAGPKSLADLFQGRDQLAVYQFMDVGPDGFCPGLHRVHQQRHRSGQPGRGRDHLGDDLEHAAGADRGL